MSYTRMLRYTLVVIGALTLVEAAGLGMQRSPFTAIWPLGDASQVDLYLGAYLAAIGAALLWIGISGALGAAVAGAIDLSVTYTGLSISLFILSLSSARRHLNIAALVCAVAAVVSAGLALWFRRFPVRDARPLNRSVYFSFVGFVTLLALVGGAVLLRMPNVFPLTLGPVATALVGCSFLGSATFFLYSLMFPVWHNAYAQLWGFLAYDLVLIVPFAVRLGTVDGAHLPALLLNTVVLVYSGVFAAYYLLIARKTRVWAPHPLDAESKATPSRKRARDVEITRDDIPDQGLHSGAID